MHAPHHVAPEWVDPYRGVFDKGWDAWREEVFARQVASGIVPEGTVLTARPRVGAGLERPLGRRAALLARQQEVFAGFLTHTDAQIGRVLSSLERLGVDGQHAGHGLLRQRRQRRGWQARQLQRAPVHRARPRVGDREPGPLRRLGRLHHLQPLLVGMGLGGQHAAQAVEALHLAGRDPHAAHRALGRARRSARARCGPQFAHAIDLMPTIMAAAGLDVPDEVDGVAQQVVDGVSLLSALEDPEAAELHHTQYFEMMGSRSIYHDGWKATTDHISTGVLDEEELAVGSRNFDEDRWELFDLVGGLLGGDRPRRRRARAGASSSPTCGTAEAERNHVLPISDGLVDRLGGFIPPAWPAGPSAHVPARGRTGGRRVRSHCCGAASG